MRRLAIISVALCLIGGVAAQDRKEPAKFELSADEKSIVEITNKEREKEKLPPVKINLVLSQVARAHSANMAKTGTFDHVVEGKSPADRVKAAGYRFGLVSENISMAEGAFTPAEVVQGWMESKSHRANIVNPRYTEIGIGIASNGKGDTYYTQVFALPR